MTDRDALLLFYAKAREWWRRFRHGDPPSCDVCGNRAAVAIERAGGADAGYRCLSCSLHVPPTTPGVVRPVEYPRDYGREREASSAGGE